MTTEQYVMRCAGVAGPFEGEPLDSALTFLDNGDVGPGVARPRVPPRSC